MAGTLEENLRLLMDRRRKARERLDGLAKSDTAAEERARAFAELHDAEYWLSNLRDKVISGRWLLRQEIEPLLSENQKNRIMTEELTESNEQTRKRYYARHPEITEKMDDGDWFDYPADKKYPIYMDVMTEEERQKLWYVGVSAGLKDEFFDILLQAYEHMDEGRRGELDRSAEALPGLGREPGEADKRLPRLTDEIQSLRAKIEREPETTDAEKQSKEAQLHALDGAEELLAVGNRTFFFGYGDALETHWRETNHAICRRLDAENRKKYPENALPIAYLPKRDDEVCPDRQKELVGVPAEAPLSSELKEKLIAMLDKMERWDQAHLGDGGMIDMDEEPEKRYAFRRLHSARKALADAVAAGKAAQLPELRREYDAQLEHARGLIAMAKDMFPQDPWKVPGNLELARVADLFPYEIMNEVTAHHQVNGVHQLYVLMHRLGIHDSRSFVEHLTENAIQLHNDRAAAQSIDKYLAEKRAKKGNRGFDDVLDVLTLRNDELEALGGNNREMVRWTGSLFRILPDAEQAQMRDYTYNMEALCTDIVRRQYSKIRLLTGFHKGAGEVELLQQRRDAIQVLMTVQEGDLSIDRQIGYPGTDGHGNLQEPFDLDAYLKTHPLDVTQIRSRFDKIMARLTDQKQRFPYRLSREQIVLSAAMACYRAIRAEAPVDDANTLREFGEELYGLLPENSPERRQMERWVERQTTLSAWNELVQLVEDAAAAEVKSTDAQKSVAAMKENLEDLFRSLTRLSASPDAELNSKSRAKLSRLFTGALAAADTVLSLQDADDPALGNAHRAARQLREKLSRGADVTTLDSVLDSVKAPKLDLSGQTLGEADADGRYAVVDDRGMAGLFKPAAGAGRSAEALGALAELLDAGAAVQESTAVRAVIEGKIVEGSFLASPNGSVPNAAELRVGDPLLEMTAETRVSDKALKELLELQTLDYLCGNPSRTARDLSYRFIYGENDELILDSIQGFNNDRTFSNEPEIGTKRYPDGVTLTDITILPRSVADALKNITEDDLKDRLDGFGIGGPPAELAATRLARLQKRLAEAVSFDSEKKEYPSDTLLLVRDEDLGKAAEELRRSPKLLGSIKAIPEDLRRERKARRQLLAAESIRAAESSLPELGQMLDRATKGVWFGSREFDAVAKAVKDLEEKQKSLLGGASDENNELPLCSDLAKLQEGYDKAIQAARTYIEKKEGEGSLNKNGEMRLNTVREVVARLEKNSLNLGTAQTEAGERMRELADTGREFLKKQPESPEVEAADKALRRVSDLFTRPEQLTAENRQYMERDLAIAMAVFGCVSGSGLSAAEAVEQADRVVQSDMLGGKDYRTVEQMLLANAADRGKTLRALAEKAGPMPEDRSQALLEAARESYKGLRGCIGKEKRGGALYLDLLKHGKKLLGAGTGDISPANLQKILGEPGFQMGMARLADKPESMERFFAGSARDVFIRLMQNTNEGTRRLALKESSKALRQFLKEKEPSKNMMEFAERLVDVYAIGTDWAQTNEKEELITVDDKKVQLNKERLMKDPKFSLYFKSLVYTLSHMPEQREQIVKEARVGSVETLDQMLTEITNAEIKKVQSDAEEFNAMVQAQKAQPRNAARRQGEEQVKPGGA